MAWIGKVAAALPESLTPKPDSLSGMQKPPSDTAFIELPQMPWRRKKKETPLVLETAPFDPRFPNMNQTRYCYQSYLDYHRCRKVKGESFKPCEYFYKCYKSLCPNAWVEKWDDQLESGTFPGRI